ncbi:alpha/beta fold hydrolase [Natronoglycomyces albus]|uniref:Alpha/beta fold hydrolase n=1 Tax=Natronoglycomyces albus TaxID=2811108 RepID=A0A895XLU8_9ACTN|nr:alpha/beta fold hydrolase [Natronoglycomyces albus]QSB04389.1 alpha/beta fold hydrolase [Natronoglycomyces albus]
MKRTSPLLAVSAAALVGASALLMKTAHADPADSVDQYQPSTIQWQECEDAPRVDCGSIHVPLNWADPGGDTIEIALARRQATNPEARVGTIVMNPGGPGGSGVGAVKGHHWVSEAVLEKFDVVGFDPRGIADSATINCDREDIDRVLEYRWPSNEEDFQHLLTGQEQLVGTCRALTGELFDHVDNLATVEDLDAIRASLGDKQLNFLGYSYGSLMGQQYAQVYPDHVRTLVLDGNMDHSLSTTWEFLETETRAAERNFNAFVAWCDTEPTCAIHGDDIESLYGQLRDAAREGDLVDPVRGPLSFEELNGITFNYANNPGGWEELGQLLADLRAGHSPAAALLQAQEIVNYPLQAIWCLDWDYPVTDFDQWSGYADQLAEEFPNMQWTPYNTHALNCLGYDGEATNPQEPLDIDPELDIVMIGTVHDYATVYEWTQSAAEQSGAALVTYEGFGHTIYGHGYSCIDEAIDAYFLELVVPKDGLSCQRRDYADADANGHLSSTDRPEVPGPFGR